MWYYYSKKSCNSPRKIRYIRYLIDRTTKRTTRMIIEKRKKKEEKSSARNIPPHPITSIYKNYQNNADSLFDQSISSKNRGGGSGKKKYSLHFVNSVCGEGEQYLGIWKPRRKAMVDEAKLANNGSHKVVPERLETAYDARSQQTIIIKRIRSCDIDASRQTDR